MQTSQPSQKALFEQPTPVEERGEVEKQPALWPLHLFCLWKDLLKMKLKM